MCKYSRFYAKNDIVTLPLSVEKFSDTEYPISEFEFIPLASGKIEVPQVSVRVRTWNGIERESFSEPLVLNVKKAIKNEKAEIPSNLTEDSNLSNLNFSDLTSSDANSIDFSENKELVERIKTLRIEEKNKLLPF